jgi:hypothetical protein
MDEIILSIIGFIFSSMLSFIIVLIKRNNIRTDKSLAKLSNDYNLINSQFSAISESFKMHLSNCSNIHNKLDLHVSDIDKILTKNYGDIKTIKNELDM